jgi:hypothetical protein
VCNTPLSSIAKGVTGVGDAERERRVARAEDLVCTDRADGLLEAERLVRDLRDPGAGVCIKVMRSGLRDSAEDRRRSA